MTNNLNKFDLIVLGGGPGGYVTAIRASQLGMKTALVEKDKLGGTCLHRGCIPTKVLLQSAHLYAQCKNAEQYGVIIDKVNLDYKQVHKRKEQVVNRLYGGICEILKKNKVNIINGKGILKKDKKILIYNNGEEILEITAPNIILATGSAPSMPKNIEIDGKYIMNSYNILENNTIPSSIIIAGGGAIGVEFASLFTSIGSKVTILEMKKHLLPMEDTSISAYMERVLKKQGVNIFTSVSLDEAVSSDGGVEIKYTYKGELTKKKAEILLLALGRSPVTERVGIIDNNIELDRNFVKTDKWQETSCPGIYAIGDLTGPMLLAHVASAQGIMAVDRIAGRECLPIVYSNIPKVTYSFPQVASFGMTQKEATEKGYSVKTSKFPFKANGRAAILGNDEGFAKVIANEADGEILGAHLIGTEASELISGVPMKFSYEASIKKNMSWVYPHPTLSEVIQEAFFALDGKAIHV